MLKLIIYRTKCSFLIQKFMTSLSYYCHHIESIFYNVFIIYTHALYVCIVMAARETFAVYYFVGIKTSIYSICCWFKSRYVYTIYWRYKNIFINKKKLLMRPCTVLLTEINCNFDSTTHSIQLFWEQIYVQLTCYSAIIGN